MPEPLDRRRRPARIVATTLLVVTVGALALLALGARPPDSAAPEDHWIRYVAIGDTLARVGGTMEGEPGHPTGLTARKAYLLAFYEAYDADDSHRMATAAQRLDALGEDVTARRIRRVLAQYPYPGETHD